VECGNTLTAVLKQTTDEFPEAVRRTLKQRGELIANAAQEMEKLGSKVNLSFKEEMAQKGFRMLAQRLRTDNKYAYLPRVLAEAGLLPGYSFPSDPGSLSLGYDPEPLFGGRLQAQREYAPGQSVYARGIRWQVTGVALHRPGSSVSAEQAQFAFTLCGDCGLANDPQHNKCARCGGIIGGGDGAGLRTYVAWDAAAFQAQEAAAGSETEEERLQLSQDVRPHPQRNVSGRKYSIGPWILELRDQEEIWTINHGLKDTSVVDGHTDGEGFHLCPVCGDYLSVTSDPSSEPSASTRKPKGKNAKVKEDPRIVQHTKRCTGIFRPYGLGHKWPADTLRLIVPGIGGWKGEGVAWAWSFAYAVIQGAVRLFDIDDDDVEAFVLTKEVIAEGGSKHQEVLDIIWIDRVVGGSGILNRIAMSFPSVVEASVKHLEGHSCSDSCYRCLRSYSNQRVHRLLDWRYVLPFLQAASQESVNFVGATVAADTVVNQGPEWDEAKAEGCESPQELKLLKAIRKDGTLGEPKLQHEVFVSGKLLTRADFAFLDGSNKVLVYVDGLYWHSSMKQRVHDLKITNTLQTHGYRVIRFFGSQTNNAADNCVEQLKKACGSST
jgi:very-short-patch-repair endonuclease